MSSPSDPIAIANLTGYPLQLALEAVTRARERECHWYVLSREQYCSPSSATPGLFIDLLISGQRDDTWNATTYRCFLVVECKRIDGDWVFLTPCGTGRESPEAFHILTSIPTGVFQSPMHPWLRARFGPATDQSAFCALGTRKGSQQGQGDRRTLEGWCRELLTATVALSQQTETSFIPHGALSDDPARAVLPAAFIPVLVTTARLTSLSFDPAEVPLSTGALPPPPGSVAREVQWIWFAKDFGFQPETSNPLKRSRAAPPVQGVLVIQAAAFPDFLQKSAGISLSSPEA